MGFGFNAKSKSAPSEVFNWQLCYVILAGVGGSIIFGYDLAFIGGVFSLESFIRRFGLGGLDASAIQAHMVNTCMSPVKTWISNRLLTLCSPRRCILWCDAGLLVERTLRTTACPHACWLGLQRGCDYANGLPR